MNLPSATLGYPSMNQRILLFVSECEASKKIDKFEYFDNVLSFIQFMKKT